MPPALLISLLFVLGFINGLRTLIPVAALCWGAHLHWFSFAHTPFAFLGSAVSLWVFTVLAVGELIGDKLPKTPPRTRVFPFVARVVIGAAAAAALASVAGAPLAIGFSAGAVGALLGTPVGYLVRRALTVRAGISDLPIALLEDAITIGGAFFLVSRF